jgi:hypothetical protein
MFTSEPIGGGGGGGERERSKGKWPFKRPFPKGRVIERN